MHIHTIEDFSYKVNPTIYLFYLYLYLYLYLYMHIHTIEDFSYTCSNRWTLSRAAASSRPAWASASSPCAASSVTNSSIERKAEAPPASPPASASEA